MSAVLAEDLTNSVLLTAIAAPNQATVLSDECIAFLTGLQEAFDSRRLELLAARVAKQARYDAGELPDFRPDTAKIRESHWKVAALPVALQDRRVEITGPTDPKMVINALNSGASCYMADFEDSTSPTWSNLIEGQIALRSACRGLLEYTAPVTGKHYQLVARDKQAVLHVRPRGLHLNEKHVLINGTEMSASLFDAGVFLFNNATTLASRDRGPYLYIPKLQSMEEAAWWNDVLGYVEQSLKLEHGSIKVTVLIETFPAAFEMDEILHALKHRIVGLNCGRWDYVFSYIKTLRAHRAYLLPERTQVTMTSPFLRAYSELLIQTCHRRGAHAMGGMAAQIPINNDVEANDEAMSKVRNDKLREVTAGHDGTWVAHPALIPLAKRIFDERMRGANQHHLLRHEVVVDQQDLLKAPYGTITRRGFANNIEVCVRYIAAWLAGNGCVPIHHLMEDAATAEIARVQLWQWMHTPGLSLHDGTLVNELLFQQCLFNLPSRLANQPDVIAREKIPQAIAMLEQLTESDVLEEFLTIPAYNELP